MSVLFRGLAYSQPIDIAILGVQVLVLLMLAYQQFSRLNHKRRLDKKLSTLFYALAEGQELKVIAPDMLEGDPASVGKWKRAVHDWVDVTRKALEGCSGNAVISFMQNPERRLSDSEGINALTDYDSLTARVNNLRGIMEHIDAYFPR
jgi:predicted signal transduction protein with EAL and GGDEF domain